MYFPMKSHNLGNEKNQGMQAFDNPTLAWIGTQSGYLCHYDPDSPLVRLSQTLLFISSPCADNIDLYSMCTTLSKNDITKVTMNLLMT